MIFGVLTFLRNAVASSTWYLMARTINNNTHAEKNTPAAIVAHLGLAVVMDWYSVDDVPVVQAGVEYRPKTKPTTRANERRKYRHKRSNN